MSTARLILEGLLIPPALAVEAIRVFITSGARGVRHWWVYGRCA